MVASERPARGLRRAAEPKERRLAKTDLGDKQVCPNCGAKFYDLRRRPATCPKCTTSFDPADEGVRSKRGRARVAAHDPELEDDEDLEDAKTRKSGDDDDEEEAEETAEVDSEAEAEPVASDDEDEDATPASGDEEIPEGFSEDEGDLGDDAGDDDSVPLIDDEEEFPEDEIGEISNDEDDDSNR